MTTAPEHDVERMRETFFRRTRRVAIAFYAVVVVIGAAVGLWAITVDAPAAAAGLAAGFALAVLLFGVSPRIPTNARTARIVVVAAPLAGVLAATFYDLDALGAVWESAVLGGFGGFLEGTAAGVVLVRRRLARDDALLLRQRSLGFDLEHPSDWLRG